MAEVVEFRSKITRKEIARLVYFLIFSKPKRWVFILGAGVSVGGVGELGIENGWLFGLGWILLWIVILFVSGYFNVVKKLIAVDSWFEDMEYSISRDEIRATIPAGTRVFPMAKLRKMEDLHGFLILSSQVAQFYISKQRISPSQLASMKEMFAKNVKISSGRTRNRIIHLLFGI